MIDTQLLGQISLRCMESLDEHEALDGGKLEAVMIIAVASTGDGERSVTRVFSSETMHYRQLALLVAGEDCLKHGS